MHEPYRRIADLPACLPVVRCIGESNSMRAERHPSGNRCPVFLGSSPFSSRTRTLVSTAIMTPAHFARNGSIHFRDGRSLACGPKTAGHFVDASFEEPPGGTECKIPSGTTAYAARAPRRRPWLRAPPGRTGRRMPPRVWPHAILRQRAFPESYSRPTQNPG